MGENKSYRSNSILFYHCSDEFVPAQDYVYGPVVRDKFLIECCTGGFGYIEINGNEFRIQEGDCYVLFPGDLVAHKTTSESFRSELYIYVSGIELRHTMKHAGITSESPFAAKEAYEPICRSIRRLVRIDNDLSISADYARIAEVYKIMSALVRGKNVTESSNIINKAIGIMDTGYDKPLTVDGIAKQVGLDRSYFSVLFREHTGSTPHAYLNSIRIERARMLMSDTDLPLSEIAYKVGMDPTCFSRMFKRETGMSPKQYRQNLS